MKLPVDGVQAFVLVAELGNYGRAADRLALSQTALTRRIQRLEEFVGLRLLDRTTRVTGLTAVGRDFLPLARRLIGDLTEGLDRLRKTAGLALGNVTLATLQSVAFRQLPPILEIYSRYHPQNRVHLLERTGSLVTQAVRGLEADFGIHVLGETQPDLLEDVVTRDPFVVVCAREHVFAKARHVAWAALRDTDLITLGGASGNRLIVESQLIAAGLPPQGRFVVESTPTALALCAANVGVALLPTANGSTLAPSLVEVPLIAPVVFRSIGLVRRRGETLSPAAGALYELLKTKLPNSAFGGDVPSAHISE